MATILAPRLERRFLLPARDVESGPPLPGLLSRLYMAPEMLEERTTFRAAALSPLRPLIPPGLGTSTELLSIMVPLDWRAGKVGAGLRGGKMKEDDQKDDKVRVKFRGEVEGGRDRTAQIKRTSECAFDLIKYRIIACLTAAVGPRG